MDDNEGKVIRIVRGGYSAGSEDVHNNTLTISPGSALEITDNIYGGESFSSAASNNTVNIAGDTTVDGSVYGGYSMTGSATGNTINIKGGKVLYDVYGGWAGEGDNSNNTVNVFAGTIEGELAGGKAADYNDATNNTVNISGGTIKDNVYGGFVNYGSAENNTVNISGGNFADTVEIYGSNTSRGSGNTLIWGHQASISKAGNFDYYNFYIPADATNGATLLTITAADIDLSNATVTLVGVRGTRNWKKGDSVVLLDNQSGITGQDDKLVGRTTVGLKLYDYEINKSADTTQLIATLTSGSSVADYAKSLSEGRVAALGFINSAADLATGAALANAMDSGNKYDLFGALSYGDSKYNSGSYADVKGSSFLLGFARNIESNNSKWTVGAFLESGNSSYDTFNNFADIGAVRANGKNNYFGGGIIARNTQDSGMYYEGSLRVGRMSNDYNSNDIDVKYDTKSTYYGAHLGVGKVFKLSNSKAVDVYGKYFWSHQNSATASIDGESFDFDSIDSNRLRIGARMNMVGGGDGIKTYVGLAYENEFSGSAHATYSGEAIAAPSIRGATGIGEIGLVYKPIGKSAFSMDVALNGYVGKRQGIGGGVKLNWGF